MKNLDKKAYIEEEAFIILHAGEIPEIAFHSSLYYLVDDPDGPGLKLNADDILPLKQAVVKRYRAMILRDLEPKNRDKRIFRGLERCIVNWQRLHKFCSRECLDYAAIRTETAGALQSFLEQEMMDVQSKNRSSCVNCSRMEVSGLAESLGVPPGDLPEGWQDLCLKEG